MVFLEEGTEGLGRSFISFSLDDSELLFAGCLFDFTCAPFGFTWLLDGTANGLLGFIDIFRRFLSLLLGGLPFLDSPSSSSTVERMSYWLFEVVTVSAVPLPITASAYDLFMRFDAAD